VFSQRLASAFAARVRSRLGRRGVFRSRPLASARAAAPRGGRRRRRRPARQARAAPRSSARLRAFAVAGLALAFFAGREHEIAEREPPASRKSDSFDVGRRFMPWLRGRAPLSALASATKMAAAEELGLVSKGVRRSRRARRTAPSNLRTIRLLASGSITLGHYTRRVLRRGAQRHKRNNKTRKRQPWEAVLTCETTLRSFVSPRRAPAPRSPLPLSWANNRRRDARPRVAPL